MAAATPAPATPAGDDKPYVSVFAKSAGYESSGTKFWHKLTGNPLVPIGMLLLRCLV
jgi:hypothetical protein